MKRKPLFPATWLLLGAVTLLAGCAVATVVGSAAGAAISVAGAVVSTGVSVTGKAIEKVMDSGSSKPAASAASAPTP